MEIFVLRVPGLSVAILLAGMSGQNPAIAAGPAELSSGRYTVQAMPPRMAGRVTSQLSVGEITPVRPGGISGITDQIFFECLPEQGLVSVGDLSRFSDYIRSALIEQLADSKIYAPDAPVQLSGELKQVDLYYDQVFEQALLSGTWVIRLELQSSLGGSETFSVFYTYPLPERGAFCEEMAARFMNGVQALMQEIIESETLDALLKPASAG
ncbi:MAG: hypothetical protein R3F41_12985 [Gammaproteobacteria bacterium]|nr:hypothetical protein [Pseudomonadales bacterium]MCP5349013.1 hypothetical protein [Pseudomonadales bacterium]